MRREAAVRAALATGAVVGIAGCAPRPAVAPAPVLEARFVAASGSADAIARAPASTSATDSTRCRIAVHFDGVARASARQLEVAMAHAWVAVTRDNDKRWDDLHLRIEARGVSASRTIVLTPTVDSAGPPLTTWQADDTTRVRLPLSPGEQPQRLFFFVTYHTVGYGGRFAGCEAATASGPLDLGAGISAPPTRSARLVWHDHDASRGGRVHDGSLSGR